MARGEVVDGTWDLVDNRSVSRLSSGSGVS